LASAISIKKNYDISYDFALKAHNKFSNAIKSIVLFGANVMGEEKVPSSIDIIMILDDRNTKWNDERMAWYRREMSKLVASTKYHKKLSINTVTQSFFYNQMIKGEPIITNIVRYGIPLIDFEEFFNQLKMLLSMDTANSKEDHHSINHRILEHIKEKHHLLNRETKHNSPKDAGTEKEMQKELWQGSIRSRIKNHKIIKHIRDKHHSIRHKIISHIKEKHPLIKHKIKHDLPKDSSIKKEQMQNEPKPTLNKEKQSKKFGIDLYRVAMVIVIIFFVSYVVFFGNILKKNCKNDENCFNQMAAKCSAAKADLLKDENKYEYAIETSIGPNCIINIKLKKMAVGTPADMASKMEGRSMKCTVPRDLLKKNNVNELDNFIDYCSGPLKDSVYEIITNRMYLLFIKNMANITSTVEKDLSKIPSQGL